jgi:hypothetical protein
VLRRLAFKFGCWLIQMTLPHVVSSRMGGVRWIVFAADEESITDHIRTIESNRGDQ